MSSTGMSLAKALETDAARVECGLKMDVSMPDACITSLTHLEMEALLAPEKGDLVIMSNFEEFLMLAVRAK